ncbi:MAG: hypothetical protein HPY69_20765 [Armatimonadetes bacterium]|nr:hypothetical protein [Armatimonadota bacterium]
MSFWGRLRNNLGLKLLSLLSALVIWGTVQTQTDPVVTRRKTLKVVPVGVPKNLAPVSIEPPEVTLTLVGRSSAFDRLAAHNPRLIADLSQATVGPYNAVLQPDDLPTGLQIREMPRSTALIELDEVATASKPVYVELRGRPAQGFAVNSWQVRPNEVTVRGPSSLLLRVDRVVAEVDVSGRSTTLSATVTAGVRDAANVLLTGVTVEPATVTVTVFLRQVNTKTVPVVPILTGSAPGLEISSVVVNPSVVTLEGPAAVLSGVDSVQTSPLDLRQVSGRGTLSAVLRVPPGCSVLGASSVRVTITVRPGRSYTTPRPQPSPGVPAAGESTPQQPTAQPAMPPAGQPPAAGQGEQPGSGGPGEAPTREKPGATKAIRDGDRGGDETP